MKIDNLKLTSFRNYDELNVKFEQGINFLIGDNGVGKTNVLEAMSLLSMGKSFVTSQDSYCIKNNEKFARIEASISSSVLKKIVLILTPDGKRILFNGKEVDKISNMFSKLLIITFAPYDVRLFKESPLERRRFLNMSLSLISKNYLDSLKTYNDLIKKRNSLLKNEVDLIHLDVLDEQIAPLSYDIIKFRLKFLRLLNEQLESIYSILEKTKVHTQLTYVSFVPYENDKEVFCKKVIEILKNVREVDIKRKTTTKGIHHDDFVFYLNGNNIAFTGSQGQNRIASLSLKIAFAKILQQQYKEKPILLLDDVFSEIDEEHQKRLLDILENYDQVFITGNESKKYKIHFTEYIVSNQKLRRK